MFGIIAPTSIWLSHVRGLASMALRFIYIRPDMLNNVVFILIFYRFLSYRKKDNKDINQRKEFKLLRNFFHSLKV